MREFGSDVKPVRSTDALSHHSFLARNRDQITTIANHSGRLNFETRLLIDVSSLFFPYLGNLICMCLEACEQVEVWADGSRSVKRVVFVFFSKSRSVECIYKG